MACLFEHNWSWPRKRGEKDMQVCLNCGIERESKVRFDGPRYRKTQDGIPNFIHAQTEVETPRRVTEIRHITSIAA